jgi:hypothetical protein
MCVQFPDGLGPGPLTPAAMDEAIQRRKRGMLESALRRPIPPTTASAPRIAAGMEPDACTGARAEEADHLYAGITLRQVEDKDQWELVDYCMLTLLWASSPPTIERLVSGLPHPSVEALRHDFNIEFGWIMALSTRLEEGIVLDQEAVLRAVALWEDLHEKDPRRTSEWVTTKPVMRVVRAAARDGQGVIVHPGCSLNPLPGYD